METVTDQPPEGEPENITPEACDRTDLPELPDMMCGGCGVRAGDHAAWKRRFGRRTEASAEVPVCLAASRHGGICGQPAPCDGSRHRVEPTPGPERRTVSLEVLTDELLALAAVEYVGEDADLLTRAKVGIVGRIGGRADAVTDVDRDWHASSGADVLANLIRQAQGRASNAGAELLMPAPDVLAALAGTPVTQALTAPVHVLAMDVKPGMLLHSTDDDGDGAETLELVSAADDCTDRDCVNGAVCAVLTVPGGGFEDPTVHFNAYARLAVRIPADQAVTL